MPFNRNYIPGLCIGLFYALSFLFRGSIAPITDVLAKEFGAKSSDIGMLSAVFWLAYGSLQLPTGLILGYIAPDRLALGCSIVFAIVCCLFAFIHSTSIIPHTIMMALEGAFSACFWLCACSEIGTKFGPNALSLYCCGMIGVVSITLISGNIAQAVLFEQFAVWRPTYWFIGGCMFCMIFVLWLYKFFNAKYPEKSIKISTVDVDLDEIVCEQTETPPTSPSAVSEVDIEEGIETERLNSNQMEDQTEIVDIKKSVSLMDKMKSALCTRANWVLIGHQCCLNGIQLAFNGLWLINYMALKYGIDREVSTMISSAFWASYGLSSIIIGKMAHKYKKRRIFYLIGCFLIFVPPMIVIYGNASMPMAVIILCNVVSGCGCGVAGINWVLLREHNDYCRASDVAGGIYNTIGVVSSFFVQWLIGILIDFSFDERGGLMRMDDGDRIHERIYTVDDYNFGFIVMPIIGALGIFLSFLVKETNAKIIK